MGDDLRAHQSQMAASRRAFQAQLVRDFGTGVNCPACDVPLSVPGMACPDCLPQPTSPAESVGAALIRMRIPTRYRDCTIASWLPEQGQPRRRAEQFVSTWPPERPLMFFSGTVGSGKTHLACAVLRAALEVHGKRGQFWPVAALLDRYRATMNADTATETIEEIDVQLRRCAVLVLDDLGTEYGTPWVAERLYRLVNERYSEELPMVVTSNVALDALPERIRSRMKDGLMGYFDGPDMRGAK